MDLKGKSIVVTGASRGLGAAIAELFVGRDARVFGLARNTDDLGRVRSRLGEAYVPVECDVTSKASVRDAFDVVRSNSGRCDVLVNNAGLGGFGPIEDLREEQIEQMIDVNLRGVVHCTRQAVPMMKDQNRRDDFGGHIVMIASVAGLVGNPNIGVYNMTKFGVRGFSEALMKELRDDRIKVTCIYPGSIATEFFDVAGSTPSSGAMDARDVAATVLHTVETSPNYLVSEVMMRPLRPKG